MEALDLADLKRRVLATRHRRFEPAPGVWVDCTLPTPHDIDLASLVEFDQHRGAPTAIQLATSRRLVQQSITGWEGVRTDHLPGLDKLGNQPLPCTPDTVALLLDAQPEWAARLRDDLVQALEARRLQQEAAAKN
jgi:hypothetical protein